VFFRSSNASFPATFPAVVSIHNTNLLGPDQKDASTTKSQHKKQREAGLRPRMAAILSSASQSLLKEATPAVVAQ
jgi:hypothetical protein